ncbi:glycosyltransferase family 2 protein [Proteiniclasticum sp. SCR006]|uniref:Glycosyltransferase family 2 protein n=1 Tax=Proteiniclasticum aestuarii TaxID=2817862 RepID=A0A939H4H1_9CLOT|nr:glycosyltransferase family 2 protein [Proteiniclasticum aestuarii]MBO1263994.1 glycosyltransferase family 2 protein [Proteiniclasticum aestuarii]
MKISIIIPVYNVESYIGRCIDSILQQSYSNFELILIDDGSSDLSGSICDEYNKLDGRIIVYHNFNSGVSRARNIGLELSSGDFIMFIDSDDFIEPNTLELFVENIEENENTLLIFNYYRYFDNKDRIPNDEYNDQIINLKNDFSVSEKHKFFYGRSYGTQIWNKLYPAHIIKSNSIVFNEKITVGEDFLFNFRVLKYIDKIKKLNFYTYNYYIRNGSITNSYKKNLYEQNSLLMSDLNKFRLSNDRQDEDVLSFYAYYSLDNIVLNLTSNSKSFNDIHKIVRKTSYNNEYVKSFQSLESKAYYKYISQMKQRIFIHVISKMYVKEQYRIVTLLMILRQKLRANR